MSSPNTTSRAAKIDHAKWDHPGSGRQRRVLLITSTYDPAMIADMHRVRHLAWELPKLGWNVEILAPDQSFQSPSCIDSDSKGFFSPYATVHLTAADRLTKAMRRIPIRGIGWQAFSPLWRKGYELLASNRFDLVYFSTTQFLFFLLGPIWKRSSGTPYILDIHDPLVREGPRNSLQSWNLKGVISERILAATEARSLEEASAIVSVSPEYIQALRRRHIGLSEKCLAEGRAIVVPFAVSNRDVNCARVGPEKMTDSPICRVVYVGAGGWVMTRSFTLLARSLSAFHAIEPRLAEKLHFEFFGTMLGWKPGDRRPLAEIAAVEGSEALVSEEPARVSFKRSLEILAGGDGALILGVDDLGYMPSKLFAYANCAKPLLAVLRRGSAAFDFLMANPTLARILWFDDGDEISQIHAVEILRAFARDVVERRRTDSSTILAPYTSEAMAARHVALFERVLSEQSTNLDDQA